MVQKQNISKSVDKAMKPLKQSLRCWPVLIWSSVTGMGLLSYCP
nr:MAG TPA: Protein of unknown function (DUF3094) [Caudoviricetes sp.]